MRWIDCIIALQQLYCKKGIIYAFSFECEFRFCRHFKGMFVSDFVITQYSNALRSQTYSQITERLATAD
ncbi:hypothetical protein D3C81_1537220 [compost metagenome]